MSPAKKSTNYILGGLLGLILGGSVAAPFVKNHIEERKHEAIRATSNRLNSAPGNLLERFVASGMPKDTLEAYSNRKPGNLFYLIEVYARGITPEIEKKYDPQFSWNDVLMLVEYKFKDETGNESSISIPHQIANKYVKLNKKYSKEVISAFDIIVFEIAGTSFRKVKEHAKEVSEYL